MINYVDYSAQRIDDDDFFSKVAFVAHNCYQVVGKTPDDEFVKRLISSNHLAMIEHYVFHFLVSKNIKDQLLALDNKYFTLSPFTTRKYLLTCSLRPLLENSEAKVVSLLASSLSSRISTVFSFNIEENENNSDVKLLSERKLDNMLHSGKITEDTYNKHKFKTIKIITDRGVTHEIVRHRPCSFAQESTRYCNYSKNKFNNSITLIRPLDYDKYKEIYDKYYQESEDGYFALLKNGATPDIARSLLPNGLKTSIIVTASIEEWNHIFELRCSEAAHPDMRKTMEKVKEVF